MLERIEVAIIVENFCGKSGLRGEHGLSLLFDCTVDGERHQVMLDVAQTEEVLMANIKAMNRDMGSLRALVLSHGHYDHTGGLLAFLKSLPSPIPVVLNADIWGPRLLTQPFLKYIGVRCTPEEVTAAGGRIIPAQTSAPIFAGVMTSGTIPRREPTEAHTPFSRMMNASLVEDVIQDETSLIFDLGEEGIIVATGCCHAGVVNTVSHALKITGRKKIKTLIGGLHLAGAAPERLTRTASFLQEKGLETVIPLHCTGRNEIHKLTEMLGDKVKLAGVGDVLVLKE